ncbi:MAG: GNAT family N-acetyltransferase [Bacteroidetes bacterium]|nr:GNAT family N-acetyltransferase [Bacteroidota bacterium]
MNLLKGDKLTLRALEPSDASILYRWENDPEVWSVSNTLVPFSKHLLEQYVNSAQDIYLIKQLRFMICIENNPIGTIDLFDFEPFHQRAGIGIIIAEKSQRQKGYASEAVDIIVDYCFSHLLLHQLYCNIQSSNEPSMKLFLEKNFNLVGVKKDWNRTKDGFDDEYLLQLINYNDY